MLWMSLKHTAYFLLWKKHTVWFRRSKFISRCSYSGVSVLLKNRFTMRSRWLRATCLKNVVHRETLGQIYSETGRKRAKVYYKRKILEWQNCLISYLKGLWNDNDDVVINLFITTMVIVVMVINDYDSCDDDDNDNDNVDTGDGG